ncbi:hypothetical protein U1Q18_041800, partial [Sarracenia purpurea var. burkii]
SCTPPPAHGAPAPATACDATERRHRSPPLRLRISDPVHDIVYRCTPTLTIHRRALHRPLQRPRSALTLPLPPPGLSSPSPTASNHEQWYYPSFRRPLLPSALGLSR